MPRYTIERCRKIWEYVTVDAPDKETAFDSLDAHTKWEEFDDETIDLRIELED